MEIEASKTTEQHSVPSARRILKGWYIATAVTACMTIAGINGWYRQTQDPIYLKYSGLNNQTSSMEQLLYSDGTLGIEGGLFNSQWDDRNLADPRLQDLKNLRNERDLAWKDWMKIHNNFQGDLPMEGAIGGALFTVMGLQNIRRLRKNVRDGTAPFA